MSNKNEKKLQVRRLFFGGLKILNLIIDFACQVNYIKHNQKNKI